MRKSINFLVITGVFVAGISTASAALIAPGMIDDFQDGTTSGWINGARIISKNPPKVKQNGDNYYLEVKSFGAKEANSRMAVFSENYNWSLNPPPLNPDYIPLNGDTPGLGPNESKWAGDYSNIARIEGRAMATSDTEDQLHLRLGISNWFSYFYDPSGEQGAFYFSKSAVEIATDGEWHDFSFDISATNFKINEDEFGANRPFADVIKDVSGIRFLSHKEGGFFAADQIKATLALDDITAIGTSTVPLPGAAWLMISGLLSLGGLSSYKRRHVV